MVGEEPATARGLAVATLAHLDLATVTGLSVADFDSTTATPPGHPADTSELPVFKTLDASFEIGSTDLDCLLVHVWRASPGLLRPQPCGRPDPGTVEVLCSHRGGEYREIDRAKVPDADRPVLTAYLASRARGGVLVEAFGNDTAAVRGIVTALLDDPLIGRRTRAAFNADGRQMSGVGPLEGTVDLRVRGQHS